MASGADLVHVLDSHRGIAYNSSGSRDLDPSDGWGQTDCSGFMVLGIKTLGVQPQAANSTGLETWCRREGLGCSVDTAQRTPGALLFVWGTGAHGHVACSRGDGTTVETPAWHGWGHASGNADAFGRGWTGGGYVPGLDYAGVTSTPPPTDAADLKRFLDSLVAFFAAIEAAQWFETEAEECQA